MRAMEVLLLALLSGSDVGSSTVHLLPGTRDQLCIINGIGHATLGMVCHLSRMGLHSARCGTLPSSEHKPSSPLYHSRELAPRIPRREDDAYSSLNPEKPRLARPATDPSAFAPRDVTRRAGLELAECPGGVAIRRRWAVRFIRPHRGAPPVPARIHSCERPVAGVRGIHSTGCAHLHRMRLHSVG